MTDDRACHLLHRLPGEQCDWACRICDDREQRDRVIERTCLLRCVVRDTHCLIRKTLQPRDPGENNLGYHPAWA